MSYHIETLLTLTHSWGVVGPFPFLLLKFRGMWNTPSENNSSYWFFTVIQLKRASCYNLATNLNSNVNKSIRLLVLKELIIVNALM